MKEVDRQTCPHCGARLTPDEIAAQKCPRCANPLKSAAVPPPPPPGASFTAPQRTDKSFQWDETSCGNLAKVGIIFFCIAFVWFVATIWINASVIASAYDGDLRNLGTMLDKKQATTDFIDWTVIVLAGIALVLGICGYAKNSNSQKLAVVTMILSAGLFFGLFGLKIREYTYQKINEVHQTHIPSSPPLPFDIDDGE